jgi:ribosomal protein S18 acetylase RimI-like enzyme
MHIRTLTSQDATAFQTIRLRGLVEEPSAFASSFEEEEMLPLDTVATRLQPKVDSAVFGSFADEKMVGVLGVQREGMQKLRHKAVIWGMYVAPEARGQGHGALLIRHALDYAWHTLRVRQVNLGVHTANDSAIRLYKRLGFAVFGTELGALLVNGLPQDEYHMVCRVPGAV